VEKIMEIEEENKKKISTELEKLKAKLKEKKKDLVSLEKNLDSLSPEEAKASMKKLEDIDSLKTSMKKLKSDKDTLDAKVMSSAVGAMDYFNSSIDKK